MTGLKISEKAENVQRKTMTMTDLQKFWGTIDQDHIERLESKSEENEGWPNIILNNNTTYLIYVEIYETI